MKDFRGIIYGQFQEDSLSESLLPVYEDLISGEFVSLLDYEGLNEGIDLNESLSLSDVKIVKEKYGQGVSVDINGVEYRYISDEYEADELYNKLVKLMRVQGKGQILKYLKNHAIPYWNSKYGDMKDGKSIKDQVSELMEEEKDGNLSLNIMPGTGRYIKMFVKEIKKMNLEGPVTISADKKMEGVEVYAVMFTKDNISEKDLNKLKSNGFELNKLGAAWYLRKYYEGKKIKDNGVIYDEVIDETTQASDVPAKKETLKDKKKKPLKEEDSEEVPSEGSVYEFPDGVFVVDSVIDSTVYLIGSDDEIYSISVKDFRKEVIGEVTTDYIE